MPTEDKNAFQQMYKLGQQMINMARAHGYDADDEEDEDGNDDAESDVETGDEWKQPMKGKDGTAGFVRYASPKKKKIATAIEFLKKK